MLHSFIDMHRLGGVFGQGSISHHIVSDLRSDLSELHLSRTLT